jgi:hypothetical protein
MLFTPYVGHEPDDSGDTASLDFHTARKGLTFAQRSIGTHSRLWVAPRPSR